MKRAIVTTTINPVTPALNEFAEIAKHNGWHLFIVGDQKTPHKSYRTFEKKYDGFVTYLDPEDQEAISQKLSDLIGWNCIQRRNFGFIAAYRWGAEVIATVDDDNKPYPNWGKNVRVGEEFGISEFKTEQIVFDPLSPTFPSLWHRGFPVQLIHERHIKAPKQKRRKVLVQADMWDGDPDIDAICRMSLKPEVKFNIHITHYGSNKPGPFNSQNTFLHRDCFPTYFLFPHIGRMDDIWAAYYLQMIFPDSVTYYKATVKQERNDHDLVKDLEAEMIGYKHTLELVKWLYGKNRNKNTPWPDFMPELALAAFEAYKEAIAE